MRMSDWSSDLCSSDLKILFNIRQAGNRGVQEGDLLFLGQVVEIAKLLFGRFQRPNGLAFTLRRRRQRLFRPQICLISQLSQWRNGQRYTRHPRLETLKRLPGNASLRHRRNIFGARALIQLFAERWSVGIKRQRRRSEEHTSERTTVVSG